MLSFTEVRLDDTTLKSRGDGGEFVIDSASIAGHWHEEISIEKFEISTSFIDATGSGGILLSGGNDVSFDATIVAKPELTGYDDVLVGAPGFDNGESDEGRAFVYHGSASGLNPDADWTAEGDQPNTMNWLHSSAG